MFRKKKKNVTRVGTETITDSYYDNNGNQVTEQVKAAKYSDGTYIRLEGRNKGS